MEQNQYIDSSFFFENEAYNVQRLSAQQGGANSLDHMSYYFHI